MKNRLHLTAVLAVGLTWGSACQAGSGFQFALYINVANTGAGDTVSWGCVNGPNVAARQIAVAPESSSWSLELGLVSGGSSTDRIDVLFAFCRLASYPVTLFVALPRSEIFTAWLNRNGGTFLALLFFFVAAVVAYRHAIRLRAPCRMNVGRTRTCGRTHWIISRRLPAAYRVSCSSTVARFGGDEFAVILTEVGGFAEAEEVAQRICVALAAPFMLPQGEAQVASSVGIALSPTHGSDAATLEEHADQALYVAKRGGGNRWCVYSPTVAASAADRGKGRRRH